MNQICSDRDPDRGSPIRVERDPGNFGFTRARVDLDPENFLITRARADLDPEFFLCPISQIIFMPWLTSISFADFFARVSLLLNRILFDCRREIFDFLELESASSQEIRYLLELESISIRKILVLLELESISIRKILGLLERESISIRKIASDFEPCLSLHLNGKAELKNNFDSGKPKPRFWTA